MNETDDLSHWDFAEHFSGYAAAALILGIEPASAPRLEHRVSVVKGRIELDYARALQYALNEIDAWIDEELLRDLKAKRPEDLLPSVRLEKMWRDVSEGINGADFDLKADEQLPYFEDQMFTRSAIIRWLNAVAMPSKYRFDRGQNENHGQSRRCGIEPEDLPWELDLALIAFQAVRNGYGDPSATYRNRLEAYLREYYTSLKNSEIERISTVANPDKERGRKKASEGVQNPGPARMA